MAPVPYLDEMMRTNVRQFQIPRFPNDKRFQNNTFAEVVNSVFRSHGLLRKMVMEYGLLVYLVYFVPLPLPYDDQKMLLLFGTKIVTLFGQRKNVFVKQKHSGQTF